MPIPSDARLKMAVVLSRTGAGAGFRTASGRSRTRNAVAPRVGKPHLFIRHLPNGGQVGTLFPLVENESQPQEFIKCAGNCISP